MRDTSNSPSGRPLPHNGVAIEQRVSEPQHYRTYEIYQRERPGQSTEKIGPGTLTAAKQLTHPHAALALLRENYPCYRDWSGNAYWLTRYDDVTSVFTDRANFSVLSRAQSLSLPGNPADLSSEIQAHEVWSELLQEHLPDLCNGYLDGMLNSASTDLSIDYALRLCTDLQRMALGLEDKHADKCAELMWHIERGDSWKPEVALRGKLAVQELLELLEQTQESAAQPNLRSALPSATNAELLATVLGFDARTLHGWIANLTQLWFGNKALTEHMGKGRAELKIAALETLRFAPPVPYAHCYAKHEVERFGRLFPEGALLRLSAEAANRDPRQFSEPDTFKVDRADICHREARGQYRADGLATAIAFGMGLPSRHPAVPEDRPPSLFALTRDATLQASERLLQVSDRLEASAPALAPRALGMFEPMIAWSIPATPGAATSTKTRG